MKCDQIAYYCSTEVSEILIKRSLDLSGKSWIKDTVTASSAVLLNGAWKSCINIAELQFNYDLGVELEILRYISRLHWNWGRMSSDPFISHIGFHLEDGEAFPTMEGCQLVQETFTLSHTATYLTTGPAAGRKYHYRIHELGPGNYVKFIRRIHPT
jgi:hypothetical protein